jgi:hypothetical protein
MSKYDYIEEFGGGGRISPQDSATAFPEGTLGRGINGSLWINQKDINGRLSWKPTSITKDKFPDMKIYVYGKSIDILLFDDNLAIKYGYDFEFAEADFIYPEHAYLNNLLEVQPLENLYNEFIKNFNNKEYFENKSSSDPKDLEIKSALQFITTELLYLQNFKNLRKKEEMPQIPTPKFNVGDKVKISPYPEEYEIVKQPFYVKELSNYLYNVKISQGGSVYEQYETALELVNEEEEKNTAFQKIDFLNPSTEENDIIIKSIANYSDGYTLQTKRLASIKITINTRDPDKRYDAYIDVFFDKVNNIIKLSEPSKDIKVWSTEIEKITKQTLIQIAEIYYQTLSILVEKLAEEPISDNTNKITSKRTKDFYDSNKSKLDKIDSKISSKFIEALAFLSQYEESGEVIYTKQNKTTANDLISRIKNLKQNS